MGESNGIEFPGGVSELVGNLLLEDVLLRSRYVFEVVAGCMLPS